MVSVLRIGTGTAALLLSLLLVSLQAFAQSPSSILLPLPSKDFLEYYRRPLKDLDPDAKWRVKIHGIRLSPLHPLVWAPLLRQRTDNRRLIPMRPFFLRDSEEQSFRLTGLEARFRFKPEAKEYMRRLPSQKDPVFDIGIAGRKAECSPAVAAPLEQFVFLRLSAFEPMPSGMYRYDCGRIEQLAQAEMLEVGKDYSIKLSLDSSSVLLELEGRHFLSAAESNLDSGLVSLQAGWHPVLLDTLRVTGSKLVAGVRTSQEYAGLIDRE